MKKIILLTTILLLIVPLVNAGWEFTTADYEIYLFEGGNFTLLPPYLYYGPNATIYFNETKLNITIQALENDTDTTYTAGNGLKLTGTTFSTTNEFLSNFTNDVGYITSYTDTNLSGGGVVGGTLTITGELIVQALTTSEDVIPDTNNIRSLGNSSKWYANMYVHNIRATNVTTTNLDSTNINSSDITSKDIRSQTMNLSSNMTLGGYDIKTQDGNLIMVLT